MATEAGSGPGGSAFPGSPGASGLSGLAGAPGPSGGPGGPSVAGDRIELRGLRVVGTHGALPEEYERAQPFEVDLDLYLDLQPAGRSDILGDTVDYGGIVELVTSIVEGPHADLLEHLAERIADSTLARAMSISGAGGIAAVTVSIRKLRPPVPADLASAGVTIHRRWAPRSP